MHPVTGREMSHLLELSDDFDLSDKNLPQISTQRKRKFRRKTRSRSVSERPTKLRFNSALVLWISIAFVSCWLIALSSMIFFLHIESKRINAELLQISATSQNLPNTLQAWHETSTSLLKNQTALLLKISDLQRTVDVLRTNFTEYRTVNDAQHNYAKDEKLVADFGAKIEAVASDIESIKDHYNAIVDKQKIFENDFSELKSSLTNLQNSTFGGNNQQHNYSDEIKILKSLLLEELKVFKSNVSIINDTLSQRSDMIHEELVVHKTKLDELFDRAENITSHVTSIENSWPEYKQKQTDMETQINRLENDAVIFNAELQKMDYALQNVCTTCKNSYVQTMQNHYKRPDIAQTTFHPDQLFDTSTIKIANNTKNEGATTTKP